MAPRPLYPIGLYLNLLLLVSFTNVDFFEEVLMQDGEVLISQLVKGTIGGPPITVDGTPWFDMPLYYGNQGFCRPIRHRIKLSGITVSFHHAEDPYLKMKYIPVPYHDTNN